MDQMKKDMAKMKEENEAYKEILKNLTGGASDT